MFAPSTRPSAIHCKWIFGVAAFWLFIASGCSHNVYEIEMQHTSAGLERKLTCWRKSGKEIEAMPGDELKRIAAGYNATVEPPLDRQHVFQGTFNEKLPEDVGGAGFYARNESPLGSRSIYQERFRGDVDAAAALARRAAAADELTNIVIGWCEQELASEPGFPKLREFLDNEFRADLKNVGLQIWFSSFEPQSQVPMSVVQYLVERGYGSPAEILSLAKVLDGSSGMSETVPRFVAGKMGMDRNADLPQSLDFLRSEEAFQQSLERYLRTTEEYQRRQAAWEKLKETTPEADEPSPTDIVFEIFSRAFLGGPKLQPSDELSVRLQTGVKPYATNGAWNAAAHQVVWSQQIGGTDAPPAFCFALWSEPNREAQRERFGRVLLEGEDLARYVDWYVHLSGGRQKAWDNFISTLKPGLGLEARIASFRFDDDPQPQRPDEELTSAADPARELLLKKLLPQP